MPVSGAVAGSRSRLECFEGTHKSKLPTTRESFASGVAGGSEVLTSSAPRSVFSQSEITLGGGYSVAPSGSVATLTSVWPGFWAIVSGGFSSLDLDGDLAPFFWPPPPPDDES